MKPYRLLAPGPVPVPAAVMRAMSERVLHHRTPQFMEILDSVWVRLKKFFATAQPVIIITGSGSSAMEAAVTNTLSPGDEVLVVVSGKFGERWAEICEQFGVKTHRWTVAWGSALKVEEFASQLRAYPKIKAVFSQACETSTATMHPIREMAREIRSFNPGALFAVDAITAVGCMPFPMDEWDIDVMIGGSQKAFMIPAGLSFIALSERAWKAQSNSRLNKYYFNLATERAANAKGDSMFSIPTPLIVGLGAVLEQVEHVGMERIWRRCMALSEATRSCGEMLGMKVYSASPSPSVTALITPTDSAKIRDRLEREHNITIMGGQDQLKSIVVRVGHMGDIRNEDMLALFEGLNEILGKNVDLKGELDRHLKVAEPLFS